MNLLYISLLITSLAMTGILALVFFDKRMKKVLNANSYNSAFSLLAIVSVSGILLTSVIGFSTKHTSDGKQLVQNIDKRP